MRIVLSVTLIAALAGCASTQTILESAPDEVVGSRKSPEEVAFCLADLNNSSALPRADGSTVVAVKSAAGTTGVVFTVMPDPEGSRLEIRRANSPVSVAKYKRCV